MSHWKWLLLWLGLLACNIYSFCLNGYAINALGWSICSIGIGATLGDWNGRRLVKARRRLFDSFDKVLEANKKKESEDE